MCQNLSLCQIFECALKCIWWMRKTTECMWAASAYFKTSTAKYDEILTSSWLFQAPTSPLIYWRSKTEKIEDSKPSIKWLCMSDIILIPNYSRLRSFPLEKGVFHGLTYTRLNIWLSSSFRFKVGTKLAKVVHNFKIEMGNSASFPELAWRYSIRLSWQTGAVTQRSLFTHYIGELQLIA